MAERTISVLGATGYTGGLIVHELRRRGLPVLAAARNADKLRRLADEAGGVQTVQVDVSDRAALERLATRSRVLINTVGPFIDYGEPVVRAAVGHGAHYLDTTGEQPFIKNMLAHDEWARKQGVAVVPAQAFEVAVSDSAAAVAAAGYRDVTAVHVTYVTRFHPSQGTQRTVLRMLQSAGYAYLGGKWVEEAPARYVRTLTGPAPIGRVTTVSFPSAEVITIPRHVTTREVRVFMAVPGVAARILSATAPLLRGLMRTPMAQLPAWLIGTGTDGPDEATRRADGFHVVVDVRGVRRGAAAHTRVLVHGVDPYGLTAVATAYGAEQMCRPDYDRKGVLPPAGAFDARPFLDSLAAWGLTYETEENVKRET